MVVTVEYLETFLKLIQGGSSYHLSFPVGTGEALVVIENPNKDRPGETFNFVLPVKISHISLDISSNPFMMGLPETSQKDE